MKTSKYSVIDRRIKFVEQATITGDNNVDTFHFDFDSEWDDFNYKYLVLIVGAKSYIDPLDENNNVILRSVAYDRDDVTFGVIAKDVPIEENAEIESTVPTLSTNVVWLETTPGIFGQIKEVDGLPDKTVWELYTEEMLALVAQGQIVVDTAQGSANSANESALSAQDSATSASTSAENAQKSADSAGESATNAKTSEDDAKDSENKAKTSEDNAKDSENKAKTSEDNAKDSENKAKQAKESANSAASSASGSASSAALSANSAAGSASRAAQAAELAVTTVQNAISNIEGAGSAQVTNITQAGTTAINNIADAEEQAVSHIQQEGTSYDTRLTALENATWRGTQAQYDALPTKSDSTIYYVEEEI